MWPTALPFYEAFCVLSGTRGYGMAGPLPITYSEMVAYAAANGFAESRAEFQEFVRLIREQDALFLTHHLKSQNGQMPK